MKRRGVRYKQYGLTIVGLKLATLACWIVFGLLAQLKSQVVVVMAVAGMVIAPVGLFMLDARLSRRQKQRGLEQAEAAIRRPLRNAVFGMQKPIDLDPHFPTVSPSGGIVSAIDPRRRAIHWIAYNFIDADGHAVHDGGPIEGTVANVTQMTLPPKRRWFGLLPPKSAKGNIELAVSVVAADGATTSTKFHFRSDDRAVDGWRRTFEQWMYEDRQARS